MAWPAGPASPDSLPANGDTCQHGDLRWNSKLHSTDSVNKRDNLEPPDEAHNR